MAGAACWAAGARGDRGAANAIANRVAARLRAEADEAELQEKFPLPTPLRFEAPEIEWGAVAPYPMQVEEAGDQVGAYSASVVAGTGPSLDP